MEAYAVVESGGKQYRVEAGETLRVERLPSEVGATVELDRVLAYSDGEQIEVGTPVLQESRVKATVVDHVRSNKVVSFKQKRRKGFRRKIGHRQELTVLRIESLPAAGETADAD